MGTAGGRSRLVRSSRPLNVITRCSVAASTASSSSWRSSLARQPVADVGITREQIVAVPFGVAGKDAVVEAEQTHHPVGHRPHRDQGAHRQIAGAKVGAGRAALQTSGQERAGLGEIEPGRGNGRRGHGPGGGNGGGGGLVDDLVEDPVKLVALPRVGRSDDGERFRGGRDGVPPALDRLRSGQRPTAAAQPVDQLGEMPGQVDRPADHIIERQGPGEKSLVVLGHGHAQQQTVQAGRPAVGVQAGQTPLGPVGAIETPSDAGRGHPSLELGPSVFVEPEPAPDRFPWTPGPAPARRSPGCPPVPAGSRRRRASGLVCRSDRSARRTRSSGSPGPTVEGTPRPNRSPGRARSPAPKAACTSGAKVSMSGHMMMTSRGSRLASAARRCSTASRITSTWRARPWQEWMRRLSSPVVQQGPGIRLAALDRRRRLPVGSDVRLDAMEQRLRVARRTGRYSPRPAPCAARTSCISRASRPQDRSSGLAGRAAVGSSDSPHPRRRPGGDLRHLVPQGAGGMQQEEVHIPPGGDGPSTARWLAGSRVRPNNDSRGGRSTRAGSLGEAGRRGQDPLRRAVDADALAEPAPQLGLPVGVVRRAGPGSPAPRWPAQAWIISGRCTP